MATPIESGRYTGAFSANYMYNLQMYRPGVAVLYVLVGETGPSTTT